MGRIPEYDGQKAKQVEAALEHELCMKHISLPNGKVNQEYEATFYIDQLEIDWIEDFYFEGLETIGLSFDTTRHRITGMPTKAGDHPVRLCCKRVGWRIGMPILSKGFSLIINPDPRSLWNNTPTNPNSEYLRPDSKCILTNLLEDSKHWSMVAASQRGRSHAHEGNPRDDYFAMSSAKQWNILTVADGAGSAPFSREGARIACDTVQAFCQQQLTENSKDLDQLLTAHFGQQTDAEANQLKEALYNILGKAVLLASDNILKEADKSQRAVKDYATTFLMTICKRLGNGWFMASFWVGDGVIGVYNKDKQWIKLLSKPDIGEFAGQTAFLTMPEMTTPDEIRRRLCYDFFDDFTALVLMTDGVTDAKFETDARLQLVEKWNALWDDLNQIVDFNKRNETVAEQLLIWLDFWVPGNHDDRTIAILY